MGFKNGMSWLVVLAIVTLCISPLGARQANPFADNPEQALLLISSKHDKKKRQCEKAHNKLDKIRDRMRSGYKASQYNSLVKKERRYKADINKYCN